MRTEKKEALELIRVFMEQRGSEFVEGVTISSAEIGNKPRPKNSGANSTVIVNFAKPFEMRERSIRAFDEYVKNSPHAVRNEPSARLLSIFNLKFDDKLSAPRKEPADLVVEGDVNVTGMILELTEEDIFTLSSQIRKTVSVEMADKLAEKRTPSLTKNRSLSFSKFGIKLSSGRVKDFVEEALFNVLESELQEKLTQQQMVDHLRNYQPS